ncbi:MAG: cysteine hydrolase [Armatimonadetes bacterium]|nr:cysteine hydrolase [Armatimonadota bacterium]
MDTRTRLSDRYGRLPDPAFSREHTALLVVDMQYLDADPDHGLVARMKQQGFDEAYAYYCDRLKIIVPNIQRLLAAFRGRKIEVIYTVIESLTRDGRERSLEHTRLNIFAAPGSKEAQVLEEIAPAEDEIILKKTCGSVFNSTILHYVLHNLGIRTLVICGVVTGGCVESAVRDASNLSYQVAVVEDACATWTQAMHDAAIFAMNGVYARVYSTDELLRRLEAAVSLAPQPAHR